jgi:serine/threonine protein kinase
MTAPQQLGPYRIVRPLGQGGMGAVYEAVQEPIGRRVALKVLLPQYAQDRDAVTRFFNEARAVNLIEHPSIVQVSDYAQVADGTVYLVMEYLRGQTLSDRIDALQRQGQRVPLREVVQLAAQLADAMSAAHDKSVIHRDLKPSNVMLVPDPAVPGGSRVKLLDFGIAKLARNEGRGTATHDVFGTPQYMSPEQCAGAGGVDAKTSGCW